jgi:hypothetical protein
VAEEKEVRTGVVFEKEECSYDRGSGERANRKIQSIKVEAGEVACCDGMCYYPVFGNEVNSATCGASTHQSADVTFG